MAPELFTSWLSDLRSGKFQQGRRQLKGGTINKHFYCCIGILAERGGLKFKLCDYGSYQTEAREDTVLGPMNLDRIGLCPEVQHMLVTLNDGGIFRIGIDYVFTLILIPVFPHSFAEIADWAEAHPHLFLSPEDLPAWKESRQ